MKSPIDVIRGRIVDFDENGKLTIEAYYPDWRTMTRREYSECNIQMIDGRPLSNKQRRTCYKLLREISAYTGMGLDPTKEWTKIKFLAEDLEETAVRYSPYPMPRCPWYVPISGSWYGSFLTGTSRVASPC